MGTDYEIKANIQCPHCQETYIIPWTEFMGKWELTKNKQWRYGETNYGWEVAFYCGKCKRQLFRIRIG